MSPAGTTRLNRAVRNLNPPLTHSCMCHQLSRKLSLTYHQWTQSPQAI